MRLGKLFMAAVVACGAMATSASAAIQAFWQQNTITPAAIANDAVLANMQSWSLMVTYTATPPNNTDDWASAGLRATLPAGNVFYHNAAGGNTKPNPALFPIIPALEFDTYVTGPADTGSGGAPAILGDHPATGPNASFGGAMGGTGNIPGTLTVAWGDTSPSPPGTYEITRLTFPQGVIPIIFEGDPPTLPQRSNTTQVNPEITTFIPQIPEPASLGLVAAMGLLALRRRND